MLLTALKTGGRLKGLRHSITRRSPKWRKRGEDGEGESSQGQRGEAAGIWVILLRNENGSLSPMAVFLVQDTKKIKSGPFK